MGNTKKILVAGVGILGSIGLGLLLKKPNNAITDVVNNVTTEPEKVFGGVPLSKLNEIAKAIHPANWVSIDQWGFLVLHYKSNRGRQTFQTQMDLDDALNLFNLNGGPVFEGQRYSHAGEFVKRVNGAVTFIAPRK